MTNHGDRVRGLRQSTKVVLKHRLPAPWVNGVRSYKIPEEKDLRKSTTWAGAELSTKEQSKVEEQEELGELVPSPPFILPSELLVDNTETRAKGTGGC